MHIDLTDPQAVWAAANPILTQPNAAAIFAKALDLLSQQPKPCGQRRIQLALCHGLALFAGNQISPGLAVLRTALGQAATQAMPIPQAHANTAFDTETGLILLRQTLVGLATGGITAFATGGVLLGLVRQGRLLAHDKDLDVVLPVAQLQQACDALPALGWKLAWTAVKAVNFRSFVHAQHPMLTLDLFGYDMDMASGRFVGGWWPVGLPREQGRVLQFEPFELALSEHPWGRHWEVLRPEALLAQLYGPTWRTPDTDYDSTLETPALLAYNDYTRTWAALRLLEAWVQGRANLVARRLRTLARLDATDPVVLAFAAPNAHPLSCPSNTHSPD